MRGVEVYEEIEYLGAVCSGDTILSKWESVVFDHNFGPSNNGADVSKGV